jgi:hypothetical protein
MAMKLRLGTVLGITMAIAAGTNAEAATIASSYVGILTTSGGATGTWAVSFTPSDNFHLSGVSLYMANGSFYPITLPVSIYSSINSAPGLVLGSLNLDTMPPGFSGLAPGSYVGPNLFLAQGTEYFMVVDTQRQFVFWKALGQFSSFFHFSGDWNGPIMETFQYRIFGNIADAPTDTPEPASMLLLGVGLLGVVGLRQSRRN